MNTINDNINLIKQNIDNALLKNVESEKQEVTLLGVTKTIDIDTIKKSIDCGINKFGENKVQELIDKYDVLKDYGEFHFIGHLQRNKVKYIIDKVALIHSVDSIRLAEKINEEAFKKNIISNILIQVNISKEESKFGISKEKVIEFLNEVSTMKNIKIKGLMTILPYTLNSEENRLYFKEMKQLFIDIKSKNINNVNMEILSMGMTNDYVVAIEEGSTLVRIGTGIFGNRNY